MKFELGRFAFLCALAFMPFQAAQAQSKLEMMGCGSLQTAYGPFDYRTDKHKLGIVEKFHFGPEQENLTKTRGLGSNIDYTLHAFPNHHRALMAMMKLGFRDKTSQPHGAEQTVECYMMRAETFRPDDAMVKVIYGLYLMQSGRPKDAVGKLESARQIDSQNANVNYNLGLAYSDLKQYDKALESAHRAYAAGFPLPGLRDKLKRAGKWRDLPQTPSPPPAPAEAPPASVDQPVSE